MEIKNILYLPSWVRILALLILSIGFASGLFFAYYSLVTDKADFIAAALTIAQFSAYGLVIALVVFFAERELSINRLISRMDVFFEKSLASGLRRIRMPSLGKINGEPIEVETTHERGQPRAFYILKYKNCSLLVQIDANIRQLLVMYHFPAESNADLGALINFFDETITGAKEVGWEFNSYIAQEAFDGNFYLELYFRARISENLLLNSPEMLFWITDISVLSRSVLKHGLRTGLLKSESTTHPT